MNKIKHYIFLSFTITIIVLFIISGCRNNPLGTNGGYYSSMVTLVSPADSASFPYGNVTFVWRKPVADQVLGYQIMINGILYNANDTFYNHNFQNPSGTFPWIVYASIVDTGYTYTINSERRYIIIH